MASKRLLVETLNKLSSEERDTFKSLIEAEKGFPLGFRSLFPGADALDVVELMMEAFGQKYVNVTKDILKKMNKADLAQRLSADSSETQQPTLMQRIETMTSVIELLLETLADLSGREIERLKDVLLSHKRPSEIEWESLRMADMEDTVFLMVKTFGEQSVIKTMKVLKKMNRPDLVKRLSDRSSFKKKHSDDKYLSAVIHKVATMAAFEELLLETLKVLSYNEFKKFKWLLQFTYFQRGLPQISWRQVRHINSAELANLMFDKHGQQSVEVTMEVLIDMNRTDLVQQLSESSSGLKESSAETFGVKTTEQDHCSALNQKVETMKFIIELLMETLADFGPTEIHHFMELLRENYDLQHYNYIHHSMLADITDMQDTVFYMATTYCQQSVEMTKEIVEKMKKTDFGQGLSESSSGPQKKTSVDNNPPALIHKVATMAAVKQLLLETLNDLSNEELKTFKMLLDSTVSQKSVEHVFTLRHMTAKADIVSVMVDTYGQQSVEETKKILLDMKRTDLVKRFSGSSSGPVEKECAQEPGPSLSEKVSTPDAVGILFNILHHLSDKELTKFKWLLQFMYFQRGLPQILGGQREWSDTHKLVTLMVERHGQQSVEVTKEILKDMSRTDLLDQEDQEGSPVAMTQLPDDLVERLSETSKETDSMDEQQPALIQKVERMADIIKLLLDILADLSDQELKLFKQILRSQIHQQETWLLRMADIQPTVFVMVQTWGQRSVEKTKEILEKVKRTDLVQRLSKRSSGSKKKHSDDKYPSALINKVATMRAVKELLLETLTDLSHKELKKFKWPLQFMYLQKGLPYVQWIQLRRADRAEIVDLMVEISGQQTVKVTMEVFMDMNRTDLVQRLSESSSGLGVAESSTEACGVKTTEEEKDKRRSALTQKVETMTSVIKLLLETLADLSEVEIEEFKLVLLREVHSYKRLSEITLKPLEITDVQDAVFFMVKTCGEQSVEKTKNILKWVNRNDLVQMLSGSSSGPKNELSVDAHGSALIHKVATIAAVKQLLLETVNHLSYEELEKFKELLRSTDSQWDLPPILRTLTHRENSIDVVDLMVQTYGQQSVEITKKILMDMNRTDLAERLSETSTGSKEEPAHGHGPAQFQSAAATDAVTQILIKILNDLSHKELEKFRWLLQFTYFQKGLSQIPEFQQRMANMTSTLVDLMVKRHGQQSVEVTREVLKDMSRTDLVERLSETSSGSKVFQVVLHIMFCSKEKAQSSLFQKQDASDWTKLEPEVNGTDADEDPTYSLQSEAGSFECSVSGLRWTCKEKLSFKFQFCSWEEHMETIERSLYMPAGPLIDITVDAGKVESMYLPHWICIDDDPRILDKFAVLHINDCGVDVEKVSEVTGSHVKLSEPVFSPRAALMKVGFPVKINCNVLIYKTQTAFLTLHVYLIPRDPGLQQLMKQRESSYEYKVIRKPHPENSLKMYDRFILTTDVDGAEICPKNLKLRYESRDPNFFEIFVRSPDSDFTLNLAQRNELQPVWSRVIRKDEYQRSGQIQGQHFVDKHQCELINRVNNIKPVLDSLKSKGVIQQEQYEQIRAIPTTQEKMRELYAGPLKAGGHEVKDIFCTILEEKEPFLVADLRRKES